MNINLPFLRTPYNYDMNLAGDQSALKCGEPTLTKQSFAEECDINTIVRRFNLTGQLPVGAWMPTYEDFDGIVDYHSLMNAKVAADQAFMKMPAEIRTRFNNDPGAFVDFCSDDKNRAEAEKMGLVHPRAPVAPFKGDEGRGARDYPAKPPTGDGDKPQGTYKPKNPTPDLPLTKGGDD